MLLRKVILAAALGLAAIAGTAVSASAETTWQDHHRGRVEVNRRLENQDRRIDRERRAGEISWRQAMYLHREDHFIRGQERFDARYDRGHLTRFEDRRLNQEEHGVSRQIGR